MNIFDREYARLSKMSKRAIALESVERGFLGASSVDYVVAHYTKVLMARDLADRIQRYELKGY